MAPPCLMLKLCGARKNSSRAKLGTRTQLTLGSRAYFGMLCNFGLAHLRNPSTILALPTPLPLISPYRCRPSQFITPISVHLCAALAHISAGQPQLPLPPSPASLLPPPAPSYPAWPTPVGLLPPPAPSYPTPPTPAAPLPCASTPEKGNTTSTPAAPCCCPQRRRRGTLHPAAWSTWTRRPHTTLDARRGFGRRKPRPPLLPPALGEIIFPSCLQM